MASLELNTKTCGYTGRYQPLMSLCGIVCRLALPRIASFTKRTLVGLHGDVLRGSMSAGKNVSWEAEPRKFQADDNVGAPLIVTVGIYVGPPYVQNSTFSSAIIIQCLCSCGCPFFSFFYCYCWLLATVTAIAAATATVTPLLLPLLGGSRDLVSRFIIGIGGMVIYPVELVRILYAC